MPENFEGQRPDEEIVLWIEKHWMKYVRALSLFSLVGLLPGVIVYLLTFFLPQSLWVQVVLLFIYIYELFILLYAYIGLLMDELDLFIVTNQRIVDITQLSLFKRHIIDTPLENIQDVAAESSGFLATMLNYGTVRVQTAGKTGEFMMDMIPDPFTKSKKILEMIHTERML